MSEAEPLKEGRGESRFRIPRRSVRNITVVNPSRRTSVRTASLERVVRIAQSQTNCDYHWDGTRILCLNGDRSLEAVNPLDGETEWTFQPAAGALQSRWCENAGRIVLQTATPNRILVLDAVTGSQTADVAALDMPWQSSPISLADGRIACVTSPIRLQLFDPAKGRASWNYEGPLSQAHAAPFWMVCGDALLLVKDGSMLTRVDPANGSDVWSTRFANVPIPDARQSLLGDSRRIWYAGEGALRCFDLKTGGVQWEQYVGYSSEQWQILDLKTELGLVPRNGETGAGMLLCEKETGLFLQRTIIGGIGRPIAGRLLPGVTLVIGESKLLGLR